MHRTTSVPVADEPQRSVESSIEKLREENAQLKELVVQLTTLVVRNVLDRAREGQH